MVEFRRLKDTELRRARQLAQSEIGLPASWVNQRRIEDEENATVRKFMQQHGREMPFELWLGAWDGPKNFIAMAHLTHHSGLLARLISMIDAGHHQAPPASLVLAFSDSAVLVDEIAVRADYHGQGVGTALMTQIVAEAQSQGATNIIAGATSEAAARFFARAGMEVFPPGKSLPSSRTGSLTLHMPMAWRKARWAWIQI